MEYTAAGTRSYETLSEVTKMAVAADVYTAARIRSWSSLLMSATGKKRKCELVQSWGKRLRALLNQKEYLTPCLPSPDDERCGHVQFTRCKSAPSGVRASIRARQFQHHHLLEQRCGWHASDSRRGSCVASSSWLRKIASWWIWSAASQLQVANDSRVLRLALFSCKIQNSKTIILNKNLICMEH